jgi:hypothetical protein
VTRPLRVVGLADTDSYVKWTAALLGTLDEGWDASLLVVGTPLVVSDGQLDTALSGSGLPRARVSRVEYADLRATLQRLGADAVVIGARGPLVRLLARDAAAVSPRPVIVTGLPGISIPATRKALVYRTQCDLFVVHSRRERREFDALAASGGLQQRFALATLPFANAAGGSDGTDLVFAAQAKVPAQRAERVRIARMLVRAAEADPQRRVVVKLRAAAGEHQTHAETDAYPELLAQLGPLPPNLVTSTAPMGRALDTAEGLVTVSSTAAIEAVARRIPVIAIDSFGVGPELINEVLADAGLLAGEQDVVARRFRQPASRWRADNYFHPRDEDDWAQRVAEMIAARREGALAPKAPYPYRGGALRDAWDRKSVLGPRDRTLDGALAFALGLPLRAAVRAGHRVRRVLRGPMDGDRAVLLPDQQPGPEGSSEHVRSTSAVRASTTRMS